MTVTRDQRTEPGRDRARREGGDASERGREQGREGATELWGGDREERGTRGGGIWINSVL